MPVAAFRQAVNQAKSTAVSSQTPFRTGSSYPYAPYLRDRELWRTPLVAAGLEYIDLQGEVAVPYSPTATTWECFGSDYTSYFEQASFGKLTFKKDRRSSIPRNSKLRIKVKASNRYGCSDVVTLTIRIPVDLNCFFVSWTGNDSVDMSNDGIKQTGGGSYNFPWKHLPQSWDWTGGTSRNTAGKAALTMSGNDTAKVVFYKGETHYTNLRDNSLTHSLPYYGLSYEAPFVYCCRGWGGRATFDGRTPFAQAWSPVTQNEVYGNPNYLNIEKNTVSTPLEIWQVPFADDQMLLPSQYPTPAVLEVNQIPDYWNTNPAATTGGMIPIEYVTDYFGSLASKPHLYQAASNATFKTANTYLSIVDDSLPILFNNTAFTTTGTAGIWFIINAPGNNTNLYQVDQFDPTTNTAIVKTTNTTYTVPDNINTPYANGVYGAKTTSYGVMFSPYSLNQVGQYALSANGTTVYRWAPSNKKTSNGSYTTLTSGLIYSTGSQLNNDFVVYEGMEFIGIGGLGNGSGWAKRAPDNSTPSGGAVISCGGNNAPYELHTKGIIFRDIRLAKNYAISGEKLFSSSQARMGMQGHLIERFDIEYNIAHRGITSTHMAADDVTAALARTGSAVNGGLTASEVSARKYTKIQYNWVHNYGLGGTWLPNFNSSGLHVRENVVDSLSTVHSEGFAMYDGSGANVFIDATTSYYQNTMNTLVEYNYHLNSARPITVSINSPSAPVRCNTIRRNVFIGSTLSISPTLNSFGSSGDPMSIYDSNIVLQESDDGYVGIQMSVGRGVTVSNNVIVGLSYLSAVANATVGYAFNVTNNLFLANSNPVLAANSIVVYTGNHNASTYGDGTHRTWSNTIPLEWKTINPGTAGPLANGQIGTFWRV